ncbi:MAG: hypothetical protein NT030_08145 [Candidatus Saganbacteria bacterium]|nr:hypothetical protein [Candidatus Saganbacteria bacterium]
MMPIKFKMGIDSKHPTSGITILLLGMILLSSCVTDEANRYYGTQNYPPKNPSEVEILWQRPQREFDVIADFQSRGDKPISIRDKAAKIGADAVIISILGGYYSKSEKWAGRDRTGNTYRRITGTAIIYKDKGGTREN